jgi:hypothetical protein
MRARPPGLDGLRDRALAIGAAVVVFGVVLITLLVPTTIGLADNGDFSRLMAPLGVHYPDVPYTIRFAYVVRYYPLGAPLPLIEYWSSPLLILWLAKVISQLVYGQVFDLAVVGVLYAALFAAGVYLIVRGLVRAIPSRPYVIALLVPGVLIFCDIAYIANFNSIYGEPMVYVSLFLLVGAALNLIEGGRPRFALLAVFVVASLLFLTAKDQTIPLVLVLVGILVVVAWLYASPWWRPAVVAGALLLLLGARTMLADSPVYFQQINDYNSVFIGVLANTDQPTARAYLRELGVDPRYAVLAGGSRSSPAGLKAATDPAFVADFYSHVSTTKIAVFYLRHPAQLIYGLEYSAAAATQMRPAYLGNYLHDEGLPPAAHTSRMSLWSTLVARVFPTSLWALVTFYLLFFASVAWEFARARTRERRALAAFCGLIALMAVIQFPLVWVGDGGEEVAKHLYLFDTLFAMSLLIGCAWVLHWLVPARVRQSAARVRYGVELRETSVIPAYSPRTSTSRSSASAASARPAGPASFGWWTRPASDNVSAWGPASHSAEANIPLGTPAPPWHSASNQPPAPAWGPASKSGTSSSRNGPATPSALPGSKLSDSSALPGPARSDPSQSPRPGRPLPPILPASPRPRPQPPGQAAPPDPWAPRPSLTPPRPNDPDTPSR